MEGDNVVHQLSSGVFIFVRRVGLGNILACSGVATVGDSRVLERVKYDARGTRHELFSSAVVRIREEPLHD